VLTRLLRHPVQSLALVVICLGCAFIINTVVDGFWQIRPWPPGQILYFAETQDGQQQQALLTAVRQWNETGLGVQFVPTRSARSAQVVIDYSTAALRHQCANKTCVGKTSWIGYHSGQTSHIWIVGSATDHNIIAQVQITAHELGHVLGLVHNHSGGCQLMNPDAGLSGCQHEWQQPPGTSPCGPTWKDVKRAERLYHQANRRYHSACWTLLTGTDQPPSDLRRFGPTLPQPLSRHPTYAALVDHSSTP
jgi:hypothetical protein